MNLADLLDPASPGALNPFRAKRGPCAFSALLRPLIGCMRAPVRKRAPVRMARQDQRGAAVPLPGEMMQLALDPQESRRRKREGQDLVSSKNSAWLKIMLAD